MDRLHRRPLRFAFAALSLLAGCGSSALPTDNSDGGGDGGQRLIAITISPPSATLAIGTRLDFTATGLHADGTMEDVTQTALWSSSDPTVANGSGGMLSANKAGPAVLIAKLGDVSGMAPITVTSATATGITMTPPSADLIVGGTVPIRAVASFSDGSQADVTDGAAWSSADASLAKVSKVGVATGVSAGSTAIIASFGGQSGMTQVTVTGKILKSIRLQPVDPTLVPHTAFHLSAIGTYQDNSTADVSALANWTSSMPSIVSVSAGGNANTIAEGSATITAAVGAVSATTLVTVMAVKLVSIEIVTAFGIIFPPMGVGFLQAIGHYADGTKADLTQTATWASDTPAVMTVSNTMGTIGVINTLTPGMSNVSATVGNVVGMSQLIVTKAKLGAIELTLLDEVVPQGTMLHFQAIGVYGDGSYITITDDVTWSTDDGTVATVSNVLGQNGFGAALMPGKTMVTATFAGVSESTSLTVTAATLDSISIAPANTSIKAGDHPQLTATAHYSDNTSSDVTGLAAWTSSDGKVASISMSGMVTGLTPGSTTITATFDNVGGTTSLTVTM